MILPWLILIPFIGGLLCWQCERFGNILPRWIALLTMALLFGLSLWLWATGDFSLAPAPGAAPQWAAEFQVPWIERFGISVHLALDGLSVLMISLTGLLGVLSVLCSWNEIQNRVGFFHLNLMWILGGVVGVFLAVDLQGDGQLDPFGDGGRLHLRAGRSRHGRCRSRGGTCNQQVPARNGKLGVVFHGASIVLALRGACTLLRTRHSKHRFGTRPGL